MRAVVCAALATALAGLSGVRAQEEAVPLDKVPKAVLAAAKKRFGKAELVGASKELTEDKKTVYEVTFKEGGKNVDVTLTPDGAITMIEKEVAFKDLPKPVADALRAKFPKADFGMIEEVLKVAGGRETLEYYEAHLTTADKKAFEAEVLPDGKIKAATEVKEEKKDEKKKD